MKAAQKRRLLTKDKNGKYINNDNYEVLRNRSIIDEKVIEETEQNYKETGLLWVVDQEETLKWLEAKEGIKKEIKTDVLEFEGLEITEDNLEDFIADNNVNIGRAQTATAKLKKVKEFINKQ